MAAAVENTAPMADAVKKENDLPNLAPKIIKQIEYYFGDVNLIRDSFLQTEMKKDDGWVKIDVLLTFNRLKQLTESIDVIVKALQTSKSGLLEVDGEGFRIRRQKNRPLPSSNDGTRGIAIFNPQTVYVKGIPEDATIDSVLEFFEKSGFPAEGVYLRRNKKTNEFKGSVFATMPSRENAQKFVAEGPSMYNETEITRLLKEDYHVKKAEERLAKRQEQKQRQHEITEEKKKKYIEEHLQKMKDDMRQGAVLVVTDVPEGVDEVTFRRFWGEFARVAWVDFTEDKKTAKIRFEEANSAKLAWDAGRSAHPVDGNDNAISMDGKPLTFMKILEGEEEETYWKGVWAQLAERRANNQARSARGSGRRGGRGSARGGRGGYRGNKRHMDDDGNDRKRSNRNGNGNKKELQMEDSDTSDDGGDE